MATLVWFIPGFGGSTLGLYRTDAAGNRTGPRLQGIWGDLDTVHPSVNLALLDYPSLPGRGLGVFPDGLVGATFGGYSPFILWLQARLPAGYQIAPWAYDFRRSAKDLGADLASALAQSATAGNQNIVVAHSYGALVAWAAWAYLTDRSNRAAMARLITFGGALYGTTSTPKAFRGEDEGTALLALARVAFAGRTGTAITSFLFGQPPRQVAPLIAVLATWPGYYDLYPDANLLDDPGDTYRGLLGDQRYWAGAIVQPNWTLQAASVTNLQDWLRVATYAPDPTKTVNIVGTGTPTPYRVVPAIPAPRGGTPGIPSPFVIFPGDFNRNALPSFSSTMDGDGRCTVNQQVWPGCLYYTVTSPHASQQNDQAVRELVLSLCLNPLPPPPPPPPPLQHAPPTPHAPLPPTVTELQTETSPINTNPPARSPGLFPPLIAPPNRPGVIVTTSGKPVKVPGSL